MRLVVPLIALLLATAAAAPPTATDSPDPSPGEKNADVAEVRIDPTNGKTVCRDTIQQVRAERGLPWVDRGTAPEPDEPLLIATVDHRIDGCSVMVMRNDTSDVRPLPEAGKHRLMPAK